ncbi:iron chelate uptake ABC transporter family permease subunit [Phycisphaera mikurensis]|uniref:Putative ABC transporter permease protein n=1 Tax=Phycisphaera mikurensis (strain NBRC 102666 / KCTC 22515 / FYK2301M01) TaxID=1142394 RepID=I0IG71_PHYMF|nr:iron chelate uptake ABC transporter family permease subunit [Phycisphaera mikurensis]MBB6440358.1 iron complex transport system permease protein [Phycisphaera mikurensis]BAM04259.1 putative ABC transporter permease protein [Phycisphaera mikurensis NBRC 102666]
MRTRPRVGLLVCGMLLVLACVARLLVGSSELGLAYPGLRAERLCVGAAVGVALATSGVALQALLRNPLAEPYLLGLSTGAAAGMVAVSLVAGGAGAALGAGLASGSGAAAGAGLSMAVVFKLGRRGGVLDPLGVLLVGVVVSTIGGAAVLLLGHLGGPGVREPLARWMLGTLGAEAASWPVVLAGVGGLAGVAWLARLGPALDVGTLDPDEAASLGVAVGRLRAVQFGLAGLLAAAAVAAAGPIAYVGLIAPHFGRVAVGPRHRPLVLASALLGAALLIGADALGAGVALASERGGRPIGVVPVGIWTAMLGGVVFLGAVRSRIGRG